MRKTEQFDGPLAVLADIAGNLPALDATLLACRQAGASGIFVAGGLCHSGADPLGVWQRLQDVGARCVRGTADLALSTIDPQNLRPIDPTQRAAVERHRATRSTLGELILARLRRLPDTLRVEFASGAELAVMSGSPRDPMTPLTHDLTDDELLTLVGEDGADVIVSGAAGIPFVRPLEGLTVVGAGSVGDAPENRGRDRDRAAHFTLISPSDEGLRIEPRWVLY